MRAQLTALAPAGPAAVGQPSALTVAGLRKSYGPVAAVRGVSFTVRRGEIFALLGPNGAGKTTILEIPEGFRMDEAQALADRLAVISAGQVVAEGTPATIGGRDRGQARIRFELPGGCRPADLPLDAAMADDGRVTIETVEPTGALHVLTGWALHRGTPLAGLTVDQHSLEDTYLRLTEAARPSQSGERSK